MNTPIGAHVSTAGGLHKAIENGDRITADCIQIFGASPRQWEAEMPSRAEVETYLAHAKKSDIGPVYFHASYLANLASPKEELRAKSIKNLSDHLALVDALHADGLIYHIGSGGKGLSKEAAMENVVEGMRRVLNNVPGRTRLIMENSAGGGTKLGAQLSEIGYMLKAVASERIRVCLDTAHAFEAGLLRYAPDEIKKICDEFDDLIGLDNLVVLHINDSKSVFDSHHDRHENIGEGHIGIEGFRSLAREQRLHNKAWILEVPGFNNEGPDKKNVDILRSCFS